ncbi:MAG: hypothetical protein IT368_06185, partial [Candidatus Hydrogenedentes bacterium]|nr:hypothetical protein [Candidatus Hydrogenedentota bacterium]
MRSIRKTILLCLLSLAAGAVAVPSHTSDYNAPDRGISLSELLRLIQFFNSGGYHCDNFGEDGYAVAPGDTGCTPHDSDYNPQNWLISLSELLRLIQFFNSGGYHFECGTEDGFAPGLGVDCFAGEGEGEGEGETPVVFGDPALEAAIREAIGNPVDPLLPADLLGLTELDASLSSIASLDGIEFCMDLATLDLHGNCIADLTPLDDLTNLISLNLHDNDISDLTPLQGLYNLDLLWLGRNNIESIAPLALNNGLTSDAPNQRWDRINLSFNPLSDGSVPADLATLQDRNVFIWTNTLPSAKHLWSAEARLRFAEAGLPAATKAITADHPVTAIAAEGSSSSLPRREQASSTKAGARPRTPKIGAPLSARVELEFTGSRVRLLNHELIPGPAPLPKRSTGRNGSLRITDNMRNTVMAALDFSLEATACGEIDESGESAGELIHLDADQRSFLLPLQGMLTRIEYLPTEGEPQILYEASLIAKGIEDCMPVEEPGDPIPISAQLIHGDPNLPDEQAYVLLLMGDGFVLDNLGDPF